MRTNFSRFNVRFSLGQIVALLGVIPPLLVLLLFFNIRPLAAQDGLPVSTEEVAELGVPEGNYASTDHFTTEGLPDGVSGLVIVKSESVPEASGFTFRANTDLSYGGTNYSVAAGGSISGDVTGNRLNIGNSGNTFQIGGSAYGGIALGWTSGSTLKGNTVVVEVGASVLGEVVGAFTKRGTLQENKVTLAAGSMVTAAFGAKMDPENGRQGILTGNSVVINGATAGRAAGAYVSAKSDDANVSNNSVEVIGEGASVNEWIYGGYVNSGVDVTLTGNSVEVRGGTVNGLVAGAAGSESGTDNRMEFKSNSVLIREDSSGTGTLNVREGVIGALGLNDDSALSFIENSVSITTGTLGANATNDFIAGAYSPKASSAKGNWVSISSTGSTISITGSVYGAFLAVGGSATENSVNISTASESGSISINGSVYGARVGDGQESNLVASRNIVALYGNLFQISGNVYGGRVNAASGGQANNNNVIIAEVTNSAAIKGSIYGAYATGGEATGNVVTIMNSGLVSDVYGAYADGAATGNRVAFLGTIVMDETNPTVNLYGGLGAPNSYTGNTLEITLATFQNRFRSIQNFQNYEFVLDGRAIVENYAVLKTVSMDFRDKNPDNPIPSVADITVLDIIDGQILAIGSQIVLVDSQNAIVVPNAPEVDKNNLQTLEGHHGIFINYDLTIKLAENDTKLVANVKDIRFNKQSGSIVENGIAEIGLFVQGADLIADQAIPSAVASLQGINGYSAFMAVSYGKQRLHSGSHVDVKGATGLLGLAVGSDLESGIATIGAFLEFGKGSFDSYNQFEGFADVHGTGGLSYIGGGLLARFEVGMEGFSRPYLEASARMGNGKSDFDTEDFGIQPINGKNFYEISSRYYGYHVGVGYILEFENFNSTGSFDLSAKYFYSLRESDEVNILGVMAKFGTLKSTRLRVGGRLNYGLSDLVRPYLGGYFEKEFDGDSSVTVGSITLPTAGIGGGTGIGEFGLNLSSSYMPINLDIGVKGFAGERDGISGGIKLDYSF
ncbi:MAG: hypothetical protein LBE38_07900 [Deltaproteobacteria bacterium]|jgi:hypothetical protein|nr:hypothetical protein [Deltaproteobacteria bacterium]